MIWSNYFWEVLKDVRCFELIWSLPNGTSFTKMRIIRLCLSSHSLKNTLSLKYLIRPFESKFYLSPTWRFIFKKRNIVNSYGTKAHSRSHHMKPLWIWYLMDYLKQYTATIAKKSSQNQVNSMALTTKGTSYSNLFWWTVWPLCRIGASLCVECKYLSTKKTLTIKAICSITFKDKRIY